MRRALSDHFTFFNYSIYNITPFIANLFRIGDEKSIPDLWNAFLGRFFYFFFQLEVLLRFSTV